MKSTPLIAIAMISALSGCTDNTPHFANREASLSESLTPEDMGAIKYVLRARPNAGEVATFRQDEYLNDKLIKCSESISNRPVSEFSVLFFQNSPFAKRNGCYIQSPTSTIALTDNWHRDSDRYDSMGTGEIIFKEHNSSNVRKFIFSVRLEQYEVAKRRIPKLPPDSGQKQWWGFSHSEPTPEA